MSKRKPSWLWGIEEVARGEYLDESWVIYSAGDERNHLIRSAAWYALNKESKHNLRCASAKACRELGITREIAEGIAAACGKPGVRIVFD